jgi:hypothetical protein
MKKITVISAFCFLLSALAPATPVWFPLIGLTGSANNRDITLIPDASTGPLIYGSNLVTLQTLLIHPIRGNATNAILPWGYTLRVDGWPRTAHIVVPNTTNLVNVVSLITNAVALGFPVVQYVASTNINNGRGTNMYLYGTFKTDDVVVQAGESVVMGSSDDPNWRSNLQAAATSQLGFFAMQGAVLAGRFEQMTGNGYVCGAYGGSVMADFSPDYGSRVSSRTGSYVGVNFYNTALNTVSADFASLVEASFNSEANDYLSCSFGSIVSGNFSSSSNVTIAATASVVAIQAAPNINITASGGAHVSGAPPANTSLTIAGDFMHYGRGTFIGGMAATNLTSLSGVITNAGTVWFSYKTNALPTFLSAPNGSICTTTNGMFCVRSNNVWVMK